MTYQIHSGILYENCENSVTRKLAYIKYPFSFTKKQILSPNNELLLIADIELIDSGKNDNARNYILSTPNNQRIIVGAPGYAKNSDPEIFGWPLSHAPRCDHVSFRYLNQVFQLQMLNTQYYMITDVQGQRIMDFIHNGFIGGWTVHTYMNFEPSIILGLFIFSKYLDKENEFLIV